MKAVPAHVAVGHNHKRFDKEFNNDFDNEFYELRVSYTFFYKKLGSDHSTKSFLFRMKFCKF